MPSETHQKQYREACEDDVRNRMELNLGLTPEIETLSAAMRVDSPYLWTWFCNMTMPVRDRLATGLEPGEMSGAEQLARQFHDTYEKLSPEFGYETREDTREFDPNSPNGKLMIAVAETLSKNYLARTIDAGVADALQAFSGADARQCEEWAIAQPVTVSAESLHRLSALK